VIRVLVVEDEASVAESLEAPFRARGMETVVCATGQEALAAPPCDVVLVDLALPGMSGVDLLERLRERDRTLPVLVLTGHATIEDAVAAVRAGAIDVLAKPVEPDVVVERVRRAVERGRIERERRARIVADGGSIGAGHPDVVVAPAADDLDLKRRVRALERDLFREALRRSGGKKCRAARLLGIDASNWAYHAKRLDLK